MLTLSDYQLIAGLLFVWGLSASLYAASLWRRLGKTENELWRVRRDSGQIAAMFSGNPHEQRPVLIDLDMLRKERQPRNQATRGQRNGA